MNDNKWKCRVAGVMAAVALLALGGCKKKAPAMVPAPAPKVEVQTPPPPPKAPVIIAFTAEPSTIERGQASTLRWDVRDATHVSIAPEIGAVSFAASRQVFPTNGTTYTLTASGPGGKVTGSATVRVTSPPPPPPPPPPTRPHITFGDLLTRDTQDAFFDFDKSTLRADARAVLTKDADSLKRIFQQFTTDTVVVEGHCDERGSAEYNLGLGDRRAKAAEEFLIEFGVPKNRLTTISYGKERPQCTESTEECWQRNRRAHLAAR